MLITRDERCSTLDTMYQHGQLYSTSITMKPFNILSLLVQLNCVAYSFAQTTAQVVSFQSSKFQFILLRDIY
jgi:hypothetical protein